MNDYDTATVKDESPKFDVILGGIQESTAEIQSALYSIRHALHRFHDTNVPSPIASQDKVVEQNPTDFTGQLEKHSDNLSKLRIEAIELSRKINQLI